jgi:predicted ATP-dependent endonuclease of OLD family
VQEEYAGLITPEAVPELDELAGTLSENLRYYVPSANVRLNWRAAEAVSVPLPRADARLEEDGYEAPVDKVGHGLQRAFILSVLQTLVGLEYQHQISRSGDDTASEGEEGDQGGMLPDLIIAIEEPELYQHPNRQRHLSQILLRLSEGTIPGVAERTQVIYSTHSPLFVDLSRFDSIRRLTKRPNQANRGWPMITQLARTDMASIARKLEGAQDEAPAVPFGGESLKARMVAIMTPWVNEGFFADVLVLVEGEDDRSAILGAANMVGFDLQAEGIGVIPCGGKASIDRPFLVFSELGIPVYVVFDGDGDKEETKRGEKANRILERLLGMSEIRNVPRTQVTATYATFETNLDRFLREKAGEEIYTNIARRFIRSYGYYDLDQCKKSPAFIADVLWETSKAGITINELEEIVKSIRELSRKTNKVVED